MTQTEENSMPMNEPPSSVAQIGIITKYEMRNYITARRFYLLLGIALAFSALFTFLIGHYGLPIGGGALGFYFEWWGGSAKYIIVFGAIVFGGDAISGEFQNKTGYFLVGNPIRRSSIYIGKYLAAVIASLIITGIYAVIMLLNEFYYYGTSIQWQFDQSFVFTLVFLISAMGLTFLFSSAFKTISYSILGAVVLFVGFDIIESLDSAFVHIEPWFLLTYGSEIVSDIFISPYPVHSTISDTGHILTTQMTMTTYNPTVPEGLAIMLAYFAVTSVLGLIIFARKEFN